VYCYWAMSGNPRRRRRFELSHSQCVKWKPRQHRAISRKVVRDPIEYCRARTDSYYRVVFVSDPRWLGLSHVPAERIVNEHALPIDSLAAAAMKRSPCAMQSHR